MASTFTLDANAGTDVWKKFPSWDVFNVPFRVSAKKPLKDFRTARITFDAAWTEQYDQAGLLFNLAPRDAATDQPPRKWVKTGLEYYNGTQQLSTVACDRYADWSITPLGAVGKASAPVTITVERDESSHGHSIWIWYHPPSGGDKVALREVGWFFAEEVEGWDLEVAAFAARPAENTKEALTVEFSEFDATWA